jgi:hypothetical protein
MEPDDDSGERGLWRNIKYVQSLTHWSLPRIADQAQCHAGGAGPDAVRKSLKQMMYRRQLRWKHSAALARAWGVHEMALLYEDFTRCATLEDLKRAYGFDLHGIIKRLEANRDVTSGNLRLDALAAWFEKNPKKSGGDDEPE